jgi:hypothetical protein
MYSIEQKYVDWKSFFFFLSCQSSLHRKNLLLLYHYNVILITGSHDNMITFLRYSAIGNDKVYHDNMIMKS